MTTGANHGYSVVELLAVLSLISIFAALVTPSLKKYDNPLSNGSTQLASFLRLVRARAISTTSAYHVVASSSTEVMTKHADKCSDTTLTEDPNLTLKLPRGAVLQNPITWDLCFSSRGLSASNLTIGLQDDEGTEKEVEVALGGAVRVH